MGSALQKAQNREWIATRVNFIENECRVALARPDGRVVVRDQVRVVVLLKLPARF